MFSKGYKMGLRSEIAGRIYLSERASLINDKNLTNVDK